MRISCVWFGSVLAGTRAVTDLVQEQQRLDCTITVQNSWECCDVSIDVPIYTVVFVNCSAGKMEMKVKNAKI